MHISKFPAGWEFELKTSHVQSKLNASQVERNLAENLHENVQMLFSLGLKTGNWMDANIEGGLI